MEFLREKLGERYDEFKELLGDIELVENDGKLIPYSRFKEVNEKKNELQDQVADLNIKIGDLEDKYLSQEELERNKREKIEQDNYNLKLRFNKAQLETMFVSAGLKEEDYSSILETVVTDDFEKSKIVVEGMINVINKQKDNIIEQAKLNDLEGTFKPQGGKDVEKKKFTDYGDDFIGAMRDYNENPDAFER